MSLGVEEGKLMSNKMTMRDALHWAFIRNIHPQSLDKELVSPSDAEQVIACAATILSLQDGDNSPEDFQRFKSELQRNLAREYNEWKKARTGSED
jgi:hypothetical protein